MPQLTLKILANNYVITRENSTQTVACYASTKKCLCEPFEHMTLKNTSNQSMARLWEVEWF